MCKVLIATGGTGGHLFPARQLKASLKNAHVVFAGHKLKTSPFFDREKNTYFEILSTGKISEIHKLFKGIWQSIRLILRLKPDVVVGFGSFHSFPVLFAAVLLRKKIVLFEANCTLGKVNRFFSRFAEKIAFQFPIPHEKAVYVPLLPWVKGKKGIKKYDKDPERITILVFGGSQGAEFINQTFPEAAKLLTFPFQVIHLTGKAGSLVRYSVPSVVMEFENDMNAAYHVADIVVCRCGASATAELIQYQKPAVLIPYPYAYDHQRKNGEFLGKGAIVLPQDEASPERLASEIEHLYANLEEHKKALKSILFPKTTAFSEIIEEIGKR